MIVLVSAVVWFLSPMIQTTDHKLHLRASNVPEVLCGKTIDVVADVPMRGEVPGKVSFECKR